eukprot:tig00021042_g17602.t1
MARGREPPASSSTQVWSEPDKPGCRVFPDGNPEFVAASGTVFGVGDFVYVETKVDRAPVKLCIARLDKIVQGSKRVGVQIDITWLYAPDDRLCTNLAESERLSREFARCRSGAEQEVYLAEDGARVPASTLRGEPLRIRSADPSFGGAGGPAGGSPTSFFCRYVLVSETEGPPVTLRPLKKAELKAFAGVRGERPAPPASPATPPSSSRKRKSRADPHSGTPAAASSSSKPPEPPQSRPSTRKRPTAASGPAEPGPSSPPPPPPPPPPAAGRPLRGGLALGPRTSAARRSSVSSPPAPRHSAPAPMPDEDADEEPPAAAPARRSSAAAQPAARRSSAAAQPAARRSSAAAQPAARRSSAAAQPTARRSSAAQPVARRSSAAQPVARRSSAAGAAGLAAAAAALRTGAPLDLTGVADGALVALSRALLAELQRRGLRSPGPADAAGRPTAHSEWDDDEEDEEEEEEEDYDESDEEEDEEEGDEEEGEEGDEGEGENDEEEDEEGRPKRQRGFFARLFGLR